MQSNSEQAWPVQDRFLELHSRWMTVIGEHLRDHQGNILEYWRIQKADSVIILPIQGTRILLPSPSYRPGVGEVTLDFPGGRVLEGQSPDQAALAILKQELGIEASSVTQLLPLNVEGWAVNSSFSNQKLYGFIAYIEDILEDSPECVAVSYPTTPEGIYHLLQKLTCLQCRAVLLDWEVRSRLGFKLNSEGEL